MLIDKHGRWKAGESGNPNGRKPGIGKIAQHLPEVIEPDDEVDEQRVTLIKYSGIIDKRFVDGSSRILHEINQPERKYDAQKTEESTKEGNGE